MGAILELQEQRSNLLQFGPRSAHIEAPITGTVNGQFSLPADVVALCGQPTLTGISKLIWRIRTGQLGIEGKPGHKYRLQVWIHRDEKSLASFSW